MYIPCSFIIKNIIIITFYRLLILVFTSLFVIHEKAI
nr:MAG TPA: hypothetical protein [Caudoviricetes sp.]